MSEADNKAFLQGTAKGNGRPFVDALADDVRWTIIGRTAWSRTYEGKRAVLDELLRPLSEQLARFRGKDSGRRTTQEARGLISPAKTMTWSMRLRRRWTTSVPARRRPPSGVAKTHW